jgi:peptide deformylase
MIKPILLSGDKILRTKSKPVQKIDKKIIELIKDLKETLKAQVEPEGVGLAAPQIGKNFRMFVIWPDPTSEIKVVINPEIEKISKSTNAPTKEKAKKHKKIMEGCLSLPNYYTPLSRFFSIKIRYRDENWKEHEDQYEGVDAQIVQHEIDHLNGILFIDRMLEQKKDLYEYQNGKWSDVEL